MRWIPFWSIEPLFGLAWLFVGLACASAQQPDPLPLGVRGLNEGDAGKAFRSTGATPVASPSVARTGEPTCKVPPLIIAYHGDSTVEGTPTDRPAPAVFKDRLPPGSIVSNEGVGGATVKILLDGTDGKHPPWDVWVSGSPATYIIINHALNDHSAYDAVLYSHYLFELVDIAQSAGKIVILETPNPTRYASSLEKYVAAMRRVSFEKKTYLIDQFAFLNGHMIRNNLTIRQITYDGVHPTQKTHDLKGRYAANIFLSMILPEDRCR